MANLGVPSLSRRRNKRAEVDPSLLSCIRPCLHILRVLRITTGWVMSSSNIGRSHKKFMTEGVRVAMNCVYFQKLQGYVPRFE